MRKIFFGRIFMLSLFFFYLFFAVSCSMTGDVVSEAGQDFQGDCVLSLCDCRCYEPGHTPEEKENKICGTDCYDVFGVKGCKREDDSCMIEKDMP